MVRKLLDEIRARGLDVRAEGDRLLLRGPREHLTADVQQMLREHKQQLLAFLRDDRPALVPFPRDGEPLPASFSQQRLWYLHEVEDNPSVYNIPMCLRLTGDLDVELLKATLHTLVRRHEALRCHLDAGESGPVLVIGDGSSFEIEYADLTESDEAPGAEKIARELEGRAMTPFDLATPPLIRASILRTGASEHHLLMVMHHVIADGVSLGILRREMISLYEASMAGRAVELSPLPLQFPDYAAWENARLSDAGTDEHLQYWLDRMKGDLPVFEIHPDHSRPPIRTATGKKERIELTAAQTEALKVVGRRVGATPFMTILSLVAVLLRRMSAQEDIIIGTPVANRGVKELEGVVGFLANTILLRVDLSDDPPFTALLERVRAETLGALQHQEVPFQKLVEVLQPPRDLSRSPIFQVFFTYLDQSDIADRMADLELETVIVDSTVARMDVSFFLREEAGAVVGSLEYNTDLFERETILGVIERLATLADSVIANPDSRISQLDVLAERDRQSLVACHRYSEPLSGQFHSLVEMFEEAAARFPDKVALWTGDEGVTYSALRRRVAARAAELQSLGVARNSRVGVCLDRGTEMVVSLLAILGAGAAYVPLDPEFPENRIRFMSTDADLRLCVTTEEHRRRVDHGTTAFLVLDDELNRPGSVHSTFSPQPPAANDLAYIIYTSGSTGRPKGVEVEHAQIANFLRSMARSPGCGSDDVLVAITTLSFDIAALEIFLPLVVGATLVVAELDTTTDAAGLASLVETAGATIMQATPATWRMLFDGGWTGKKDLKALVGGESLPPELAQALTLTTAELWNMYGPTETTIWSTCGRVDPDFGSINIGRPIAGTVVRVVDENGHQVPTGVPGELWIGGAGVARGYRNRPELNAESFLEAPIDSGQNARFYRTGDVVRMLGDGVLEFVGRRDNQVKLEGFRIELGEIETALERLSEIRAAVAAVKRADGRGRLVAYIIYEKGRELLVSEIRKRLRTSLPYYMIPGMVIELTAFPLTPNGKIDREALPNPLESGVLGTREYSPPEGANEKLVAAIWRKHLGNDKVGRADNFFELGGHSLLSLKVVSEIEEATSIRLDPRKMFFQTLAQIAADLTG